MLVQNILYNIEQAPPQNTWDRIATVLDNGSTNIKDTLYNHSITPDALLWDNIATVLDNGTTNIKTHLQNITVDVPAMAWENILNNLEQPITLQDKLYNQAATVPDALWEKINTKLDINTTAINTVLYNHSVAVPINAWANIEQQLNNTDSLQQKLFNHTVKAPENAWANITQQLDNSNKLTIVYKRKNFFKITASAAACLLVAVGIGIFTFNNNGTNTPAVVTNKPANINNPTTNNNVISNPTTTVEPNIALEPASNTKKATTIKDTKVATPNAIINDVAKNDPSNKNQNNLIILNAKKQKIVVTPGTAITPDITYLDAVGDQVVVSGPNGVNFNMSSSLVSKLYISFNSGLRDNMELLDQRIEEASIWRAKYNAWKQTFDNDIMNSNNLFDFIEKIANL
jgi:hypothetical protein